jgi:hypothetical protein
MAGRTDLFTTTLPSTVGPSLELSGSGSPEGVVAGVPGQTFVNIDNLDLYQKIAGVQTTGWKLVGKKSIPLVSVQSAAQVTYAGPGSPVGVIFPTVSSAFYTQTDTDPPGQVWNWYNNSWVH